MGSTRAWEPRRTMMDLYTERDAINWCWRVFATLAAWMILGGFMVFPLALADNDDSFRASRFALGVFAITLLSVGYLLSVLLCFVCQSWLFLQDAIFLPCLSSCALGLFNILFNVIIRKTTGANNLTVASIVVAIISMFLYGSAAIFVYRKIIMIHKSDHLRRERPASWGGDEVSLISADEMQRRQLLRLLFNKDGDRALTPEAAQSTFRIDLPDPAPPADARSRSVPPPPTWEVTSPPFPSTWARPPSTQATSRSPSPSDRELRRVEIEREPWGSPLPEQSRGRERVAPVAPRIRRVQTDGFHSLESP